MHSTNTPGDRANAKIAHKENRVELEPNLKILNKPPVEATAKISQLEATSQIARLEKTTGKDGKARPAGRKPGATPAHALHYGTAQKHMVVVVPDARWPGMYRVAWPDGQLSDMANLTRAKDAAAAICERGPPARNKRRFHWKRSETPTGACLMHLNGGGCQ